MKLFKALLTAASLALISTSAVQAESPLPRSGDKLVKFGDVGDWTVYENTTRGDCLIVTEDGNGAVQMGVTAENKGLGYLGVFTKQDIGLGKKKNSKIFVSIGGNLYEGVATQVSEHLKGGYMGGYILSNNPQFREDVAKKYKMIVFPDTIGAFVVDLTGTFNAMKMARKCFLK